MCYRILYYACKKIVWSCSPCQSLVDHGQTKITQYALKTSLRSAEVISRTENIKKEKKRKRKSDQSTAESNFGVDLLTLKTIISPQQRPQRPGYGWENNYDAGHSLSWGPAADMWFSHNANITQKQPTSGAFVSFPENHTDLSKSPYTHDWRDFTATPLHTHTHT